MVVLSSTDAVVTSSTGAVVVFEIIMPVVVVLVVVVVVVGFALVVLGVVDDTTGLGVVAGVEYGTSRTPSWARHSERSFSEQPTKFLYSSKYSSSDSSSCNKKNLQNIFF